MSRTPTKRRGPMGGHGGMGMSVEKAKDFKGTMKTLWSYLSNYKFAIILVAVFALEAPSSLLSGLNLGTPPLSCLTADG